MLSLPYASDTMEKFVENNRGVYTRNVVYKEVLSAE